MDLTSLTRDELVSHALTRGIGGAEYLTRDELLRLLGAHTPKPAFAGATKWIRGLLANFVDATPPAVHPLETRTDAPKATTAAAEDPANAAVRHEPIRTMTMARLLVEQGHVERARLILSELDTPNAEPNFAAAKAAPESESASEKNAERESAVAIEVVGARTLLVRWNVSKRGKARAQRLLDTEGALTLRVVAVESDGVVRSRILTFGELDDEGSMRVESIAEGATCLAAVGLSTNGRFVAIAHAPRCTLKTNELTHVDTQAAPSTSSQVANAQVASPDVARPHVANAPVTSAEGASRRVTNGPKPPVTAPRTITQSGAEIAPRPLPAPAEAAPRGTVDAIAARHHEATSAVTGDAIWAIANAAPSYPAHVTERGLVETKRTSAIFIRN
jgi:hypothetical protein